MADSIYEFVGGGVTIGDAISGGSANQILFGGASTNVAQSSDLFFDSVLKIFHVGDFGLAANKTYIALDDQNNKIDLQTKGTFKAGDIGSYGNDNTILLDDVGETITIGKVISGAVYSSWDNASHVYSTYAGTGHYIGMTHQTGTTEHIILRGGNSVGSFWIDNVANEIKFVDGSNVKYGSFDLTNDIYQIGNLASSGTRGRLYVDGATGIASLRSFDSGLGTTAQIQTNTTSVSFSFSNATRSSGLSGGAGAAVLQGVDNASFDSGNVGAYYNAARLYFTDGSSGYVDGVEATTRVVKVGDYSGIANSTLLTVDDTNSRITVSKPFGLKGYTVATLPTGFTGATAYVTDALAPTFLATIVGGGAIVTPVFYNGTNRVGF